MSVLARSSLVVALASALALVGACSSARDSGAGPTAGASGGSTTQATQPAEVSPVRGVPVEVLRRVCAGTCGGRAGSITVLRDAAGAAQRFQMAGYGCDDGPTTFYDASGTEIGGIALQPVLAGSPEAEGFRRRHEELVAGLSEAEHLSCRTVPGVR